MDGRVIAKGVLLAVSVGINAAVAVEGEPLAAWLLRILAGVGAFCGSLGLFLDRGASRIGKA